MTSLSTPSAIVLGFGLLGGCTGLGLYFGLRGRPAATTLTASSAIAETAEPRSPFTHSIAAGASASSAAIAATKITADSVQQAIRSQHDLLVEKCWNPSFARTQTPAQVKLNLTVDYGEGGKPEFRSLQQEMRGGRPDVTSCVNKELVTPAVDPPGQRVHLVVPIVLP